MSATEKTAPAVTATPLSLRLPAPGRVVISTAARLLAGLSFGSLKPKSSRSEERRVGKEGGSVWLPTEGASCTEVTLRVIVFGLRSRSTLQLVVPPPSSTG